MAEPIPVPPPEVPVTLVPALLALAKVSALFVVLGIIAIITAFVDAMFGWASRVTSWIPFVGGAISAPIHHVEQTVTLKLGTWMENLDGRYGAFFYALSQITADLAQGNVEAATLDFIHARKFRTLPTQGQVSKQVGKAVSKANAAVAQANTATLGRARDAKVAKAQAKAAAHTATVGVAGTLDHVLTHDIPNLRDLVRSAEDRANAAWKWIRAHPVALAEGVAVGALAVALTRLGIGWIRCRNWKRIGKHVCGLPFGLIDELLAASFTALAATDICDFADAARKLATQLRGPLITLVDVEEALVHCHGSTKPPPLSIGALSLPDVPNPLPLDA